MASTDRDISFEQIIRSKSSSVDLQLTERELVVLRQTVAGLSSKEIARSLDISPRTVEFHRANLLRKYGARNTADLVRRVVGA